MGIRGLLSALNLRERDAHLSAFRGQRLGVDGFAWLHRAAFASVHQVVLGGEDLSRAVRYFLRRAALLRAHEIDALFVFDGRGLPSKAETNRGRREKRQAAREQAETLLRQGDTAGASRLLTRAISVSFDLVLATLKALRREGFRFLVAPYEADAQLGYLCHIGALDAVVSEDSDLILYGCRQILFKLDETGYCQVGAFDPQVSCQGLLPGDVACEDALIVLCALSGCDYIEGVKGVGLKKGAKFVARGFRSGDAGDQSPGVRLRSTLDELRLAGYSVAEGYDLDLRRALWTFKHQLVFNPTTRELTRRYPLPQKTSLDDTLFQELVNCLGPPLETQTMIKICEGLLNPTTLEPTGLEAVTSLQQQENKNPSKLTGWLTGCPKTKPVETGPTNRKRIARHAYPSYKKKIIKLEKSPAVNPEDINFGPETVSVSGDAQGETERRKSGSKKETPWDRGDTRESQCTESTTTDTLDPASNSVSDSTVWDTCQLESFVHSSETETAHKGKETEPAQKETPQKRGEDGGLRKPRVGLGLSRRSFNLAEISALVDKFRNT